MLPERSVGLQWKLGLAQLTVGVLSVAAVLAGFFLLEYFGFSTVAAVVAAGGLGVVVSLAGSGVLFWRTRAVKLRLWEAGDFAGRIARGDFSARLDPGAADEVGWLEEQLNRMAVHLELAVLQLRDLAEQNRKLAEDAGRGAALEERARLARDLHDTVNQQLFALGMGLATLRRHMERAPEQGESAALAVRELTVLETLARETHAELRKLILHLRPTHLETQGLGAVLREYAHAVAQREGWRLTERIDSSVRLDGEGSRDTREHLFRMAQEVLTNIGKHAGANVVQVSLFHEDDGVVLHIQDDGVGFDPKRPPRPTSLGLTGLRERAAAIGAQLEIASAVGQGASIVVRVPVMGLEGES